MPTYKTSRWTSLLDEIIATLLDSKFLDISQTLLVANQVAHPLNFAEKLPTKPTPKKVIRFFVEAFSFRAGGFFQNNSSILPAFIELLGILGRKTREVFGVVLEFCLFWVRLLLSKKEWSGWS